jgi:hypothetical protein
VCLNVVILSRCLCIPLRGGGGGGLIVQLNGIACYRDQDLELIQLAALYLCGVITQDLGNGQR